MALQVGIVGLPNVGKSTLFKALTKNPVDINNYPFCTIEPNVGIVEVPDERVEALGKMSNTQKYVYTAIEFVDIAGLVAGASKGEGLGNKFLANIREVDAIAQVVRVFENTDITHVHETIDPVRDIEVIETELILADLATLEKTVQRLGKLVKSNDKDALVQMPVVAAIQKGLEEGVLAREIIARDFSTVDLSDTSEAAAIIIREMSLLTTKPVFYIYNVSDVDTKLEDVLENRPHVKLDIKIEEELMEMSADDAKELGMESHLPELITRAYELLDLQTFLTTGEVETRAWTFCRGATAPEAAGAIHTDFTQKFIRAEIINWQKLLDAGSFSAARDKGTLQTVGKDYIMADGDVADFKI